MKSTAPDDLPTHPDALRDLVLQLLREREEKDTEHARLLAVKDRYLTLRDETIARLEMTIAKLRRCRFGRRSEKFSSNQIVSCLPLSPRGNIGRFCPILEFPSTSSPARYWKYCGNRWSPEKSISPERRGEPLFRPVFSWSRQ